MRTAKQQLVLKYSSTMEGIREDKRLLKPSYLLWYLHTAMAFVGAYGVYLAFTRFTLICLGLVGIFFAYRYPIYMAKRKQKDYEPQATAKTLVARDRVKVHYETMNEKGKMGWIGLANGLGGRLYSYNRLVKWAIAKDYAVLTWDYRGLFVHEGPKRPRHLSIPEHAEDLKEIMKQEGIDELKLLVGWSTGVQVALEFAAVYPENVDRLALLNGCWGHVFAAGGQPLFRIPGFSVVVSTIFELQMWLLPNNTFAYAALKAGAFTYMRYVMLPWAFITNNPSLEVLTERYLTDIFGHGPKHTANYIRLFQELDAHSVYHVLPYLAPPALLVSGYFDFLTPAYMSYEIAHRMPTTYHSAYFAASHFAMAERPEDVVSDVASFLAMKDMRRRFSKVGTAENQYARKRIT
eukprot:Clim_evm58s225 gene=Clim_evmTU58s225